jgi:transposase
LKKSIELQKHLTYNMYVKIKYVQDHIRLTYQKELAISVLHAWLKKHKFSYKKPKLVPINAYPEAQETFVKQ